MMADQLNALPNKYTRWYFSIVNNRRTNPASGYVERHHITPKSLGGSNASENIVRLTAREHYVCHWILTKMFAGDAKRSMHFAFHSMRRSKVSMERYVPNSHIYDIARRKIDRTPSDATRAKMRASSKLRPPISAETRKAISEGIKASYTPELRAQRSKQFAGREVSMETRAKQSASRVGLQRSDESRKKQSDTLLEHCARAKMWVLLTPDSQIVRTTKMPQFCKERNLNYFSLRNRAQFNDQRPITRGPSKGWSVLGCRATTETLLD